MHLIGDCVSFASRFASSEGVLDLAGCDRYRGRRVSTRRIALEPKLYSVLVTRGADEFTRTHSPVQVRRSTSKDRLTADRVRPKYVQSEDQVSFKSCAHDRPRVVRRRSGPFASAVRRHRGQLHSVIPRFRARPLAIAGARATPAPGEISRQAPVRCPDDAWPRGRRAAGRGAASAWRVGGAPRGEMGGGPRVVSGRRRGANGGVGGGARPHGGGRAGHAAPVGAGAAAAGSGRRLGRAAGGGPRPNAADRRHELGCPAHRAPAAPASLLRRAPRTRVPAALRSASRLRRLSTRRSGSGAATRPFGRWVAGGRSAA